MTIALIATVFNEGESVVGWLQALQQQTRQPDEFVIVDGGSTDGTPEMIERVFAGGGFPPPRVIIEKCNIARGRNLAIQNTTAEILVSTDAGSFPEPDWLEEITRPLLDDLNTDAVGGKTVLIARSSFEQFLVEMEGQPLDDEGYYPSSRNIAMRRKAWECVGGYPEWLTLAGEDALFNYELHAAGVRFACSTRARVRWPIRPTPEAYFKLLYRNAYGAAEAQMFASYFLRRLLLTVFPPLLLLSRHRFNHFKFRYRKNASSALGWLAGKIWGRRAPRDWKRRAGILLSPETQRHMQG